MARTFDLKTIPNQSRELRRLLVVAAAAFLLTASPHHRAVAKDDLLRHAINYVFTGTIDPKDPPEIADRKSCVVVVPDPKWKRFIRYYLSRFRIEDARIDSTYSGRQPIYQLDIGSDKVVVEYLNLDKTTVVNGYKSAQIPLPGDIDQTKKALQIIAEHCKRNDAPKLPF